VSDVRIYKLQLVWYEQWETTPLSKVYEVPSDKTTHRMLCDLFPMCPHYDWHTFKDEYPGRFVLGYTRPWGLYLRIEHPYGKSTWPYVRLWCTKGWRQIKSIEEARIFIGDIEAWMLSQTASEDEEVYHDWDQSRRAAEVRR
jgi:hypothetical protein